MAAASGAWRQRSGARPMARAEGSPSLIWRPRTPAHRRLRADPRDFRHLQRGARVGVFLGHSWSGGVIEQVDRDGVLVRLRRQGEPLRSAVRVADARNLVPQQQLRGCRGAAEEQGDLL